MSIHRHSAVALQWLTLAITPDVTPHTSASTSHPASSETAGGRARQRQSRERASAQRRHTAHSAQSQPLLLSPCAQPTSTAAESARESESARARELKRLLALARSLSRSPLSRSYLASATAAAVAAAAVAAAPSLLGRLPLARRLLLCDPRAVMMLVSFLGGIERLCWSFQTAPQLGAVLASPQLGINNSAIIFSTQ